MNHWYCESGCGGAFPLSTEDTHRTTWPNGSTSPVICKGCAATNENKKLVEDKDKMRELLQSVTKAYEKLLLLAKGNE